MPARTAAWDTAATLASGMLGNVIGRPVTYTRGIYHWFMSACQHTAAVPCEALMVFSNLTIRLKVFVAFGLLLLVVLALGTFAIDRLASVNAAAGELRNKWLPSTQIIAKMGGATFEQYPDRRRDGSAAGGGIRRGRQDCRGRSIRVRSLKGVTAPARSWYEPQSDRIRSRSAG